MRRLFDRGQEVKITSGIFEEELGVVKDFQRRGIIPGKTGLNKIKKETDLDHPSDSFTYSIVLKGTRTQIKLEEWEIEEYSPPNSVRFINEDL